MKSSLKLRFSLFPKPSLYFLSIAICILLLKVSKENVQAYSNDKEIFYFSGQTRIMAIPPVAYVDYNIPEHIAPEMRLELRRALSAKNQAQSLLDGCTNNLSLEVIGETICHKNQAGLIRILNTEPMVNYIVYKDVQGSPIASAIGNGTELGIIIPINTFDTVGNYFFKIKVEKLGCPPEYLIKDGNIIVRSSPNKDIQVIGDTVCMGQNARIILSTEKDVIYNLSEISGRIQGDGNDISIPIDKIHLIEGKNSFKIAGRKGNCSTSNATVGTIIVNGIPDSMLAVSGSKAICLGQGDIVIDPTVTIKSTELGVLYKVYIGVNNSGLSFLGTGNDHSMEIPLSALSIGDNEIYFKAISGDCPPTTLKNKVIISLIPAVNRDLLIRGTSVCLGRDAKVTINSAEAGVKYQAYIAENLVGNEFMGSGNDLEIIIPADKLSEGENIVSIHASNGSCTNAILTNQAIIIVAESPDTNNVVYGTDACLGIDLNPVIYLQSQTGVSYQAYLGSNSIGNPEIGTGEQIIIYIPGNFLSLGENVFSIHAKFEGCTEKILKNKAIINLINNDFIDTNLTVTGGNFCLGSDAAIEINSSQETMFYSVTMGDQATTGEYNVGASVPGTGNSISIFVPKDILVKGDNVFTIYAHIGISGCWKKLTNKAIIKVNDSINTALTVTGGSVCNGSDATILINPTESGIIYQAYIGSNSVGNSVTGTGNSISISIPNNLLSAGDNVFTIRAKQGNCGEATLDQQAIVKVVESIDNSLNITGSTVCPGSDATIQINSSESGVVYQAYIGSNVSGNSVVGTGNNISLNIPNAMISTGDNLISIHASKENCPEKILVNQANVKVLSPPNTSLAVTGSGNVCLGSDGSIQINSSELGVMYQAYLGSTAVGNVVNGTGSNINIIIPNQSLKEGENLIFIHATKGNCQNEILGNQGIIFVYPVLDISLTVRDTSACSGVDASVQIYDSQIGISYQAFISTNKVGEAILGNGTNVSLVIPSANLNKGSNLIRIQANRLECTETSFLSQEAYVTVLENLLNVTVGEVVGPKEVCKGSKLSYKINSIPGISSYEWISPNGSIISKGNGTNQVEVVFNDDLAAVDSIMVILQGACGNVDTKSKILSPCKIFIPNVLTPNSSIQNNEWAIEGLDENPNVVVRVYNRWGSLVWESIGYNSSRTWKGTTKNGEFLPIATYYYIIEINKSEKVLTGSVTVLR